MQWADLGVTGAPRSMGDESTIAQVHPKKLVDGLWSEAQRLAGSSFRRGSAVGVLAETLGILTRRAFSCRLGSVVGVLTEEEGGAVSDVRLSDG